MGKNIRSSSSPKALATSFPMPPLADAMDAVRLSVDRFCLLAGVEALAEMMEEDATTVCGARHRRHGNRRGYRWGHTQSEIGYHGGRVKVQRPRVRDHAGKEVGLESWQVLRDGNLLLEWALNLMVLNVSTRKYHRAVRLPEGDLAKARGDGTSKSAVSRRFVALSRKKMKAWLASDLSELDLLVIQIDGLHVGDHVLVAAIGVWQRRQACPGRGRGGDGEHCRRPGLARQSPRQGARSDAAPAVHRRWREGAQSDPKHLLAAAIQRCQVHKGRNIIERLPLHLHASVKKALRQAWDQDDATRPNVCCATWPGVWSMRNRASRAASWRGWTRSSPSSASACRTNSGARSPAPTSSRTRSARCARSPATSNAGDTPRWRSDGPPPACWRPRKPSVASRPIVSCPSSEMLSRNT